MGQDFPAPALPSSSILLPTASETDRPRRRSKDKPPSLLKRLRYRLEGAALEAAALFIPVLPRPLVNALGWCVGAGAYFALKEDRQVGLANLDIAFGDTKSPEEKKRIVMSAFRNLASNLLGLFWGRRLGARNVGRYVKTDADNLAWLEQVRGRGKGVILVTPHYGDWELGSLAAGLLGIPYTTVAEPTKNPAIERIISRLRSRSGHTTVPPRFAVVKLYKALSRGGTVTLLIDVNARRGRGGVWLDFFGLPVFNTGAVAELAMRTGAAIVFVAAHPLPGRRINLTFGPEIEPSATGDHEDDVLTTSQRCLDACAALIREHPEHWLWTYKRWKRRPAEEMGRFPFYSKYDENTESRQKDPALVITPRPLAKAA
ncbi:MAG TPA: lysophospholipid acyltransferase family protein [Tepidisphaeraceae bacterium]|nr:lysophospholipid acyltransferase family protein [Tepidisphaeraceae bacterium]